MERPWRHTSGGRPAITRDPKALRIAEIERSSPHLRHQLRQAQAIIEVHSALLEILLNGPEIGGKH